MNSCRIWSKVLLFAWLVAALAAGLEAQSATSGEAAVPQLIPYTGVAKDANGKPIAGTIGITFLLYQQQEGGAPLWLETQNVQADSRGNYSVQLGAESANGVPSGLFISGEARWLAIQISGQAEQPRIMLLSVPYAMKAGDAATIGGLPPSAFLLASPSGSITGAENSTKKSSASVAPQDSTGTQGYIPLWIDNSGDLGNSALFQSGSGSTAMVGVNTSTPSASVDVGTGDVLLETGNLDLPQTTSATTGVITMGGAPFISACCANNTFNTFIGEGAGNFTTSATGNTAVGYDALTSMNNLQSTNNTAIGTTALTANLAGASNTAVGVSALLENTYGTSNTAVGVSALQNNTQGLYNTAVGQGAGSVSTGSSNTFIGQGANVSTVNGSTSLTNATAIGANAVVGESNALVLGTPGVKVGIGTSTPAFLLDVQGSANFTGLVNFNASQTFPGTVTGVSAATGGGLTSSTNNGSVALGLTTSCASGQVLESSGSAWACANAGIGTITGVTNGTGLTGGGTSGNVTLNVDPTQVPFLNSANNTFNGNLSATGVVTGSGFQIGSNLFDYGSYANQNAFLGFAGNTTTTGTGNTASGYQALSSNNNGGNNTGTGFGAGNPADSSNLTGSNNSFFGANAFPSTGTLNNATAIGANAEVSASNALVLGSINGVNGATTDTSVGIGTTAPRTKLEIDANVPNALGPTVTLTNNGGYGQISLDFNTTPPSSSGTYNPMARIEAVDDSNYSDHLYFQSNTPGALNGGLQTNMVILSNGNVGIGTTTPAYNLDVHGAANFTGVVNFAPNQTFPGTGTGTITGVTAGGGLTGGGTSGNVALSLTNSCASGQVLQWSGSAWVCSILSGGGTITGVVAGTGLVGGASSGVATLSLNTDQVPQLATANTFAGTQTINGNLALTGSGNGVQFPDGTMQTTAATSSSSGVPSGYMILGNTPTAPPGFTMTGILGGTGVWLTVPSIPLSTVPTYSTATVVNNTIYYAATGPANGATNTVETLLTWDTVDGWNPITLPAKTPLITDAALESLGSNGQDWVFAGRFACQAPAGAQTNWSCTTMSLDFVGGLEDFALVPASAANGDPAIMVLGGMSNFQPSGAYPYLLLLDTVTMTWAPKVAGPALSGPAAVNINGSIDWFGGYRPEVLKGTEQPPCDSSTNEAWSLAPTLNAKNKQLANVPVHVYGAQATVLNGQVYLLGGTICTKFGGEGTASNSVFVYNPATNTWSSGPAMPVALASNFSAVTANNNIFVISGLSVWEYSPPVYMFTAN